MSRVSEVRGNTLQLERFLPFNVTPALDVSYLIISLHGIRLLAGGATALDYVCMADWGMDSAATGGLQCTWLHTKKEEESRWAVVFAEEKAAKVTGTAGHPHVKLLFMVCSWRSDCCIS